jgi:hypothetical protein
VSDAIFVRDGDCFIPQDGARGPWDPNALHGSAVAALLTGAFNDDERTLTRVSVDLLAPVPFAPLTMQVTPPVGGRRATRQTATLRAGDRVVATADCVAVTQLELELPQSPAAGFSPFDAYPVPDLTSGRPRVGKKIGWEGFDTLAVAVSRMPAELPGNGWGLWMRLLMPVVEGVANTGAQTALAAADYSSNSTSLYLPFDQWSYRNADLVVHLSRPPVGEWVGLVSTSIAHAVGSGVGLGALFDEDGRLGQSAQSLVVERRREIR